MPVCDTALPLNGRDWAQLATLEPGVASVRPHEAVDAPGGSTRGLSLQLTVDGKTRDRIQEFSTAFALLGRKGDEF